MRRVTLVARPEVEHTMYKRIYLRALFALMLAMGAGSATAGDIESLTAALSGGEATSELVVCTAPRTGSRIQDQGRYVDVLED